MAAEDPELGLANVFAEVARILAAEHEDPQRTYDRICAVAVETIDHCDSVGVSLIKGKRVDSVAGSDPLPRVMDQIQDETQQGPSMDAIRGHDLFITGHVSQEQRWPEFVARVREETGVESIASFRLFCDEDTMGALNLYSRRVDAFDAHDEAVGAVFAAHAAVAMSNARREEELERKASSRDVIGQAKGILMARSNLTEEQAFDVLRNASQRLNVKLRDLAERVASGEQRSPDQL